MNARRLIKEPTAFLPLAMSAIAILTLAIHIARFGVAREADEGTAAHVWQLMMGLQVPIIAFFAIQWLRRAPRSAFVVLGLQLIFALAAMAPVYLLHL
jgi:hypothetical protein